MAPPVEVFTTRGTPCACAALSTFTVPSTFTRASLAGSATDLRTSICAARWKITSGFVRLTRRLTAPASRTSATSSCAPFSSAWSRFSRLPVEMSSSTVTSSPRASRASTRFEPMKPAPPVTSEFMRRRILAARARASVVYLGRVVGAAGARARAVAAATAVVVRAPVVAQYAVVVERRSGRCRVGRRHLHGVGGRCRRLALGTAAGGRALACALAGGSLPGTVAAAVLSLGRERLPCRERLGGEADVVARDRVREQADAHRGHEAGDGEGGAGCEASETHHRRG